MSQGSQSRAKTTFSVVILLCLVAHFEHAHASTFIVGDGNGWSLNVVNWPNGKTFRVGDTLVFKYNPSLHNVVAVDKPGYDSCRTPAGATIFTSGNDHINLAKGWNYFICNFPQHCESLMKIAVNAV